MKKADIKDHILMNGRAESSKVFQRCASTFFGKVGSLFDNFGFLQLDS